MAAAAPVNPARAAVERPWMCSSRKGLRFCGIIELEPTRSSAIRSSPNSSVVHQVRSRAARAMRTPRTAAAESMRSTKSREATASTELGTAAVKPRRSAVRAGSTGTEVPPTAPAPSGLTSISRPASSSPASERRTPPATPVR